MKQVSSFQVTSPCIKDGPVQEGTKCTWTRVHLLGGAVDGAVVDAIDDVMGVHPVHGASHGLGSTENLLHRTGELLGLATSWKTTLPPLLFWYSISFMPWARSSPDSVLKCPANPWRAWSSRLNQELMER